MDYILGMSGSDNTTTVNIASITGVVLQHFTVGPISLHFADEQTVTHNLAEAFVMAQMAGYPVRSCKQVCLGIAGMPTNISALPTPHVSALRDVVRRCGYMGDTMLLCNEQIALAGALSGKKGAILLADNTSACFGQNTAGAHHRTGGLGTLADDDGSAYAIGREVLRAVARASDGRGKPTQLTTHIYRKFRLPSATELARLMRSATISHDEICSLADLLPLACGAKDPVALNIVSTTSAQLASLVAPVVTRLRLQQGVLAVAGKVLLNDAYIGIAFKKTMAEQFPELSCVPPLSDSAAGAVLLAKERLALRGYPS